MGVETEAVGENGGDELSLQVRFTTRQTEFAIPTVLYSVSSSSKTDDLSNLISMVLKEADEGDSHENVAFDFRVGDEVLRSTLEEFIQSKRLGKETVLELEYFIKETAPEPHLSCPHPDWVAALSSATTKNDTLFLTGCYDGSVNLWSLADGLVANAQYHSAPVKSVCLVKCQNEMVAISGSHDQTVMVARVIPAASRADDWQLQPMVVGKGHAGSVDCIATSPNLQRFASGSWDTMLKIWDLNSSREASNEAEMAMEEETEAGGREASEKSKSHKRKARKLDIDDKESASTATQRCAPLVTLSGHREGISDLVWLNDTELVTVGFDHALVFWDMAVGQEKQKIPGVRAFLSVAYSPNSNGLLTSSTDRHIRLYDSRSQDGHVVKSTFTSHSTWVSAVDWSKTSEHLFISGSYDKLMKLWDVRSPKTPLYDMSGHEDKILDVCWTVDSLLASGSADTTLKIFSKRS